MRENRLSGSEGGGTEANQFLLPLSGIFGGGKNMRSQRMVLSLSLLLWLQIVAAIAQAQTSRAASAVSYIERGASWMEKGEIDRAIADYDIAIAFDAQSSVARYNRGVARQRKGDLAGALEDF